MIAQAKGFDCFDHDPIDKRVPAEPAVIYWLVLHIGFQGEKGSDMFTVPIATPAGLETDLWKTRKIPKRGLDAPPILLSEYSWAEVLEKVQAILEVCPGKDWDEVSGKLMKIFQWEFKGYQEWWA